MKFKDRVEMGGAILLCFNDVFGFFSPEAKKTNVPLFNKESGVIPLSASNCLKLTLKKRILFLTGVKELEQGV